mgnify:CR=1 FL=1
MNLGIIAIALSVACLVARVGFGAPVWVNAVGIGLGLVGLFLIGRGRK